MANALNLDHGGERFNICLEANGDLQFKANAENCGGTARMSISDDTGNVGIGTTNPGAKLEILSPWADWMFLQQQRDVQGGGGFHIHNPWANSNHPNGSAERNALVIAYRTHDGHSLWSKGLSFHGPTGTLSVGGDIVFRNADCAEEFVLQTQEAIEPGMVMVLSEAGSLSPSTEAYDKKVAGVVSGAGDLRPGLILDKQPESTNRIPIALMGKVYCQVDAEYAEIDVGDLLTTSPTPGHAMKAIDPMKAFGAVLGKALWPLATGKGLIPILVTLQ